MVHSLVASVNMLQMATGSARNQSACLESAQYNSHIQPVCTSRSLCHPFVISKFAESESCVQLQETL